MGGGTDGVEYKSSVAYVNWNAHDRKWNVNVYRRGAFRWNAGNCVFSRNSQVSPVSIREREFSIVKEALKKYHSLSDDIEGIKPILIAEPEGIGKHFVLLHATPKAKIVKVDLHCESLRARSVRMIYAYHPNKIEFMYIEVYFKGSKENEDREQIRAYIKYCT